MRHTKISPITGRYAPRLSDDEKKAIYYTFKNNPNLTGWQVGELHNVSKDTALHIISAGLRLKW